MMSVLTVIIAILQIVTMSISLGVMAWGFKKFLSSPRRELELRVAELETDVKDLKREREVNEIRFKKIDDVLEVILRSTIALIEFEVQYCLTENKIPTQALEKAREGLNEYLAKR